MSGTRSQVIDGVQIPERLIAEEAQNHPAGTAEEARRAAGHALAIRALLLDRAHALGLEPQATIQTAPPAGAPATGPLSCPV